MSNIRHSILKLFPKRQPVNPKLHVVEGIKTNYGIRELIEYSVAPNERVRAFVLSPPKNRARRPGVLASHQHAGQYWLGKREPAGLSKNTMFHYGVELCCEGYVVICPDYLGFEERAPSEINRREETALADREYEAFIFADQILQGSSLTAKYVFDMCQALDVLEEFENVNTGRLGVLGHSLGGQMSLWHAFYDERVKVAFSSCGFGTMKSVQKHQIRHNFAAYLPGLLTVADIDDVVAGIAPRAFGMSHGTEDLLFPIEGIQQIRRKARQAFPSGKFLAISFKGPHSFPVSVKRRAYAFLRRFL